MDKKYIAIDLKSFYASVECVERGLDPLDTNLVVADSSRTEKTICLAVSPSLKSYGIGGRARLFEVVACMRDVNARRLANTRRKVFDGESYIHSETQKNPNLSVSYITAPPRMAFYSNYSTKIYQIYLKYVSPDDIHVYSIDEVFIDVTSYLKLYSKSARELAEIMISDVLKQTGITATVGIGTNLYLAKIAMDIMAKRMPPDKCGARIAELDEISYRHELWNHTPLIDFWRIGKGYSKKLNDNKIYTMGDVAELSLTEYGEKKLYKLFGINAELLIDHAWGWEPCTIADIKKYKPQNNSISSGQVLHCPYNFEKTRLIIKEMAELLSLDLVAKRVVTDQIVLTVGYDIENLREGGDEYHGETVTDPYGRKIPKHAHGTANIGEFTSSTKLITDAVLKLFDDIADENLLTRRINICANHVIFESDADEKKEYEQLDLFTDYDEVERKNKQRKEFLKKERSIQETMIELKQRFGKNVILKGMNFEDGATTISRNGQIGGHKA